MSSPFFNLISLGLRHVGELREPLKRAEVLDAGADAIEQADPKLAESARTTAAMIRSAESAQGRFFEQLPDPNSPDTHP